MDSKYTPIVRRVAITALGCAVLVPAKAHADSGSKEAMMAADAMQTASEKALLLRAQGSPKNTTGMDSEAFATLVAAVEQKRFDVLGVDPNTPEVKSWCERSAQNAAQKNGDVDTKGEAKADQGALNSRCSEVYQYDLSAKHKCVPVKDKMSCDVEVEIKISKFTAGGDRVLNPDMGFGKNGVETVTGKGSAESKDPIAAQRAAAFMARLFAERGVRDIPYFQIRSPLAAADNATSSMCLGKDIVELDQPFYVYKVNADDSKTRVGWGKVREAYDGCVMTKDLEEQEKAGKKIELKPTKMQNIIGRGDIKPGMTAWEMPSVGLNIGLQGGFTTDAADKMVPRIDLTLEYDLARHIGISELHAAIHAGYVLVDNTTIDAVGKKVYDAKFVSQAGSSPIVAQTEIGLVKRWYGGRFTFDLGAFAAGSYYQLYSGNYGGNTVDIGAYSYGAAGKAGIGVQLAPRWALRANVGYRYTMLTPSVKVDDVELTATPPGKLDAEQGLLGALGLSYTY